MRNESLPDLPARIGPADFGEFGHWGAVVVLTEGPTVTDPTAGCHARSNGSPRVTARSRSALQRNISAVMTATPAGRSS